MRKNLFLLPGYFIGIGCLGLITYRTLAAVGTTSKTIILQVNQYGEQYLDVALLALMWIVCLLGFFALRIPRKKSKIPEASKNNGAPPDCSPYTPPDAPNTPSKLLYKATELSETSTDLDESLKG